MNSLPQQPVSDKPVVTPISSSGVGKEIESAETTLSEVTKDVEHHKDGELPKEVSAVGVRLQPTIIELPTIVQNAGVQVVNTVAQPVPVTTTIALPLSDEQMAKGLHESVVNSVRWLTEWCVRRLKQMHILVHNTSEKLVKL